MSTGGSGFYVLRTDRSLAYLMIDPLRGSAETGRFHLDRSVASFYEIVDEQGWVQALGEESDWLVGLQRALREDRITLHRLIKSPMGKIRDDECDLRDVTVVGVSAEMITIAGHDLPKVIKFDSPHVVYVPHRDMRSLPVKTPEVFKLRRLATLADDWDHIADSARANEGMFSAMAKEQDYRDCARQLRKALNDPI